VYPTTIKQIEAVIGIGDHKKYHRDACTGPDGKPPLARCGLLFKFVSKAEDKDADEKCPACNTRRYLPRKCATDPLVECNPLFMMTGTVDEMESSVKQTLNFPPTLGLKYTTTMTFDDDTSIEMNINRQLAFSPTGPSVITVEWLPSLDVFSSGGGGGGSTPGGGATNGFSTDSAGGGAPGTATVGGSSHIKRQQRQRSKVDCEWQVVAKAVCDKLSKRGAPKGECSVGACASSCSKSHCC
jgi:hypothetical protein